MFGTVSHFGVVQNTPPKRRSNTRYLFFTGTPWQTDESGSTRLNALRTRQRRNLLATLLLEPSMAEVARANHGNPAIDEAEALLKEAGFDHIELTEMEHDSFNLHYLCRVSL